MDSPFVCAIILGWNRPNETIECVHSLSDVDYSNLKVLLVDNGSRDGTPQRVKAAFPKVQLIVNKRNLGFAAGSNVGIEFALQHGADYVLLLNNDAVVATDAVRTLVNVAETDGRIGMLTPKIYSYHHRTKIWSAGARKSRLLPGLKRVGFGKEDGRAYERMREVEYTTACAILVRAEVFRVVGLFDPTYFMYFEDCDLSLRVRRAGYKIVYVPEAKVWHKDPLTTKNTPSAKWYHLARSTVPFCRRYARFPYLSMAAYVGWVVLRECSKGNYDAVRPCVQGLMDGLVDARTRRLRYQ